MEFGMGIDPTRNFAVVNKMRRDCPVGYKKRHLDPKKQCKDEFTIGTGKIIYASLALCSVTIFRKRQWVS